MGYRVYKFISEGRIYEKSNYLIRMTLSIEAQFYIQLVFKAPLFITLTISDQKIVSGSLFFQIFSNFS